MNDPVDDEFVHDIAVGLLEEWLDGVHTEVLVDGRDRRVKHWSDDVYVVYGGKIDRRFRVRVEVEEVQ